MKYDIAVIAKDIKAAKEHAKPLAGTEDGGTCNFDSAFLYAPRMKDSTAQDIATASGVHCFLVNSNLYGRILQICIGSGQGNRRTVMAEAAKKFLASRGHKVGMWYQMD